MKQITVHVKSMAYIKLVMAVVFLFVAGCQLTSAPSSTKLLFLEHWAQGDSRLLSSNFTHKVEFISPTQTYRIIVQGEYFDRTLVIVGLSEVGMPLFEIKFNGETLDYRNRTGQELPLNPYWLVESFQLMFWPADSIKLSLLPRCQYQEYSTQRSILCAQSTGVRIDYSYDQRGLKKVNYRPLGSEWQIFVESLN